MIFGEYDLVLGTPPLDVPAEVLIRLFYMAFSTLIAILLLNVLIAIINSTFSTVQSNSEVEWREEILELLVEIDKNFTWMDKFTFSNKKKETAKYLHTVVPTNQWNSKEMKIEDVMRVLGKLTRQVDQLTKQLEKLNK